LLDDRVARPGAIRATSRATDRTGQLRVNRLDIELVPRPARALDLDFHFRELWVELNRNHPANASVPVPLFLCSFDPSCVEDIHIRPVPQRQAQKSNLRLLKLLNRMD